jgi:hypothetical protein
MEERADLSTRPLPIYRVDILAINSLNNSSTLMYASIAFFDNHSL